MALSGKDGAVYLGANKVAEIKNWKLDLKADTPETTNFSSNGWKEFIAGLKEWSGSAEGNFAVNTDTNGQKAIQNAFLNGTTLAVELRVNSIVKYSGNTLVTGISVEEPVDGVVSFSSDLQGTGALTYSDS